MDTRDLALTSRKTNLVKTVGFGLLIIFSFFYSVFHRKFAEMHASLPFLNFPIFLGEILLGICLVLVIWIWATEKVKLKFWHGILGLYLVWVLTKAAQGYISYGPLALRNAALFYYPFFAVCGYTFYRKEFFTQPRILGFLMAFIFIMGFSLILIQHDSSSFLYLQNFQRLYRYFTYSYLAIFLILWLKVKNRWLRYLFVLACVLTFPLARLFDGARAHLISVIMAVIFLLGGFLLTMFKNKRGWQLIFALLIGLALFFGVTRFGHKTKIKSMFTPLELLDTYRQSERTLQEKLKSYELQDISIQLYNPEKKEPAKSFKYVNIFKKEHFRPNIELWKKAVLMAALPEKERIVEKNALFDETLLASLTINEERKKVLLYMLEADISDEFLKLEAFIGDLLDEVNGAVNDNAASFVAETKTYITPYVVIAKEKLRDWYQEMVDRLIPKVVTAYQTLAIKSNRNEIKATQAQLKILLLHNLNVQMKKLEGDIWTLGERNSITLEYNNMLFRFYIWKDMLDDLQSDKFNALWGMNWGKPQRSKRVEVSRLAWGEWTRDGWITPHNSWFHYVYRGGVIGLIGILGFVYLTSRLTRQFIREKSVTGVLLISIIVYWFVITNFLVILELPYTAIPFWSLCGMILAFARQPGKEQKFQPVSVPSPSFVYEQVR